MTRLNSYLRELVYQRGAPLSWLASIKQKPLRTAREMSFRKSPILGFLLTTIIVLSCFIPTEAFGQIDLNGSPTIDLAGTGFSIIRAEVRSSGEFPNDLNRKDCVDDFADYTLNVDASGQTLADNEPKPTSVLFRPQVRNVTNRVNTIEIWVTDGSADCTNQDERGANSGGRCWLVAQSDDLTGNTVEIHARPRNIMRGNSIERTNIPENPSEEICDNQLFNQRSLTFYLLVIDGSDIATSTTWTGTLADNTAPPPPNNPSALPGDQRLFVNWSVDTGQEDTDTLGFRFFCVPVGDDVGLPGDGLGGSGGEDGSTACTTEDLTPGEVPNTDFACGNSLGRTSREGRTNLLENQQRYALGIAGTDQIFNLGLLSELTCGTPEEVTTFFEGYREAGGKGGGGFCQSSPVNPQNSIFFWLLCATGTLFFWRRHRKSSALQKGDLE